MLKTVTRQVRRRKALRHTLGSFREPSVEAVCERFAPLLEEGEDLGAALELVLDVLERCLDEDSRSLDRAESRHIGRRFRLAGLRRKRDEAAREVRQKLVEIRNALTAVFDRDTSNWMLGLEGRTARVKEPLKLLNQAEKALGRLEKPGFVPTDLSESAEAVPLEDWQSAWRDSLKRRLTRFRPAYMATLRESGNRQTVQDKNREIDLHSEDLSAIARFQEVLLILGRERDLARKVWQLQRPQGRPPRRKARKGSQTEPLKSTRKVSSREVGPSENRKKSSFPH